MLVELAGGKVRVPKGKTITLEGEGDPVLVYGDTASSAGSTSKSASVSILADNFIARGMTFKIRIESILSNSHD